MMTNKSTIEAYSLQATLRSYKEIIDEVDKISGRGSAIKSPGLISTLLRFQEETLRSITELVIKEKITIEEISNLIR
jgi:hypothetical protein